MKRFLATLSLIILAGCTLTPGELREQGTRTDFSSSEPPAKVAMCLTRNIEEYTHPVLCNRFQPQMRDGRDAGTKEVLLPASGNGFLAYAEIRPSPSGGSSGSLWTGPVVCPTQATFVAVAIKGC